ncbi:retinol dehydrogenase 7 [Octopus sinensis]|uniref:Retinol dehydrogenase 7 n=1 Tax=Octopus sinensis TaxID=2607531 RepID=A0A6P7SNS5_9MOLL|nr:retinol dehydrogenase 7 [Octopus sinensis]
MFCTTCEILSGALIVITAYLLFQWFLRTLKVGDFNQKYVLVTGCDTGFGNMLAKQLDELGFNVFAACLTKEGVADLRGCCTQKLEAFLMNVTKKEEIEKAEKLVRSRLPDDKGLWALVNNAGVLGTFLFPECMTRKHYDEVMDVNIYGTIGVTTAFLPLLRVSRGRIVNVSSIFGKVTPSTCIPYCISKHAVESYSNGLRCALIIQNVTVHIIQPGGFATNLTSFETIERRAIRDFEASPIEVQQYYGKKAFDHFISVLRDITGYLDTNLQRVVSCHIHAITARYPKYRYTPGFDAQFLIPLLRMLPVWLSDRISIFKPEPPAGLKTVKTQ